MDISITFWNAILGDTMRRLLILMLAVSAVWGQEYDSFFEEFDVILHQLQVNVADRDGKPIRGLKAGDFKVILDGKEQTVELVEEIDLTRFTDGLEGEEALPQQARRLFVFFFDMRFSTKQGVLASQEAAREFIMTEMLSTDLVAVFNYTQLAGVSLVTNFTNDQGHLLDAVATLGLGKAKNVLPGPSGYFLNSLIDDVIAIQGFDAFGVLTTGAESGTQGGGGFASEHTDEIMRLARNAEKANYEREVMGFLSGMNKFADALRFIRGRKNMIWFSSGFDSTSLMGQSSAQLRENAEFAFLGMHERVPGDQLGRGDVQSTAMRAIEALQASGTVVFAVDTSRIDGGANEKSGLHTLNYFSVDTGGRTFSNRNDYLDVITKIQDMTNHYYMVSFYPETKSKKNVGKLRVKVPGISGTKVTTNRGLLLNPDFQNMTRIEKDIHIAEYIARDQVIRGIPLEMGMVQVPMNQGFVRLSLSAELRGDYFMGDSGPGKARELEVFAIAFEKHTNRIFDQSYFQFKVDPQRMARQLEETGIKYFANLFVKPGDYKIKLVVRDLASGKIGSAIQEIAVNDKHRELAGPVLVSDKKWVMVKQPEEMARRTKAGDLDFSYPFSIDGDMLIPSNDMTATAGGEMKLFYLLNYSQARGHQNAPRVQAMFVDGEGQYIMIPPDAVKARSEFRNRHAQLTGLEITIDLDRVPLKKGETYRLFTNFDLNDGAPIRSVSEITLAGL